MSLLKLTELLRPLEHRMVPCKFRDDISNGSGVIVLTDRQTDKQTNIQTDTADNNTMLVAHVLMTIRPKGHTVMGVFVCRTACLEPTTAHTAALKNTL